jgi:hypothetical protein
MCCTGILLKMKTVNGDVVYLGKCNTSVTLLTPWGETFLIEKLIKKFPTLRN